VNDSCYIYELQHQYMLRVCINSIKDNNLHRLKVITFYWRYDSVTLFEKLAQTSFKSNVKQQKVTVVDSDTHYSKTKLIIKMR
jgi:hypothetical protein